MFEKLYRPAILVTTGHEGSTGVMMVLERLGLHVGTNLSGGRKRNFYENGTVQGINQELLGAKGFPYPWPLERRAVRMAQWLVDERKQEHVRELLLREVALPAWREERFAWGFKDPRICLTFPFWLRVFPKARCIFLHRRSEDARPGWNRHGDWGYDHFKRCWQENLSLAMAENAARFILDYDELSFEFRQTCHRLCEFLGLEFRLDRVEAARNLWRPKHGGVVGEARG